MTDEAYNAQLKGNGALAQGKGAVAASRGSVAVGRDVHGDVIVNVQGENVRSRELDYLEGLRKRYQHWQDHYTPLAGVVEVRAAVEDGPTLDLPMPFLPREFEMLAEHGFRPQIDVREEVVNDLRSAVRQHRRVILLGASGSGKTTTLWRLAHDYALAAKNDPHAPLPAFVKLDGYTDNEPFAAYLARQLGPLAPYMDIYRASGRLILLLDGLDELPRADYAERVEKIQATLDQSADEMVVITCRRLDYVEKLKRLQKVKIKPLNGVRIHEFLHKYLGKVAGERLFWRMAGETLRDLWKTWQQAGGTWEAFWTAEMMPDSPGWPPWWEESWVWQQHGKIWPPLLQIGRNPYLLLVTARVYATEGGQLPSNRAQMFDAFVDTLLKREKGRHPANWIAGERQKEALSALAYAMQAAQDKGARVEREWATAQLNQAAPGWDPERILYFASSATLLDTDETTVRFHHLWLQEYFVAREMGRRVEAGAALTQYWPPDRWWEPSGWEETAILMIGMAEDTPSLLDRLARANPVVAARCLLEDEPAVDEKSQMHVTQLLLAAATDGTAPVTARAQSGRMLAKLGDPRPGVGLHDDGLLDIVWCTVPAGPFVMGSTDADEMAYASEKPQHTQDVPAPYQISRYPVTHAQYAAFVRAGGYDKRRYWTETGWAWREREDIYGPATYSSPYDLSNHPVVGVSWYEAVAFCRWLTELFQERGHLDKGQEITLPTEPQWEKAARSTDGRGYPWGGEPDAACANYKASGLGTTSAVGCFPTGKSPYGVEDLSGNVWEWCRTQWEPDYEDYRHDNNLEGFATRVLRGGSFSCDKTLIRCAARSDWKPHFRYYGCGFRVVRSRVQSPNKACRMSKRT